MVYRGGIYEAKIEISDFVLYYHVCANRFGAFVYRSIFPSAVGNDDAQYGDYAGCKGLDF